jgi:uncharacterized lipoprotein YbaY
MVYATAYFWVVICKNHRFHHKGNTSYAHQIALAETDPYSPLPIPPSTEHVRIRCNDCGAEHSYKSTEILRNEIAVPENFTPHPLFQDASLADQPSGEPDLAQPAGTQLVNSDEGRK